MEETHIRSLKSRLKYLEKHTMLLEEAGCEHGFAGEIAALQWAIPKLELHDESKTLGGPVRVSCLAGWDQGRTAQAGTHKGILGRDNSGWVLIVGRCIYPLDNDELVIVD